MSKCLGCGITLQNKEQSKLGYTPNLDNIYCERCFKTIHYNQNIEVNKIDNTKIIKKINNLKKFTIFIGDIFNLNKEIINIYHSITNSKILVLNKCDLIPNNLKLEHLEENIKKVYNIDEEIIFISAKNKMYLYNINKLIEYYKEVIFCGETSSGKSTLINNLFNTKLTTSKYKNTTLDFIKLKKEDYVIYDTPGILLNNNVIDKINVYTKKLTNDYILTINDIKIKVEGNITVFIDKNISLNSKKDNSNLEYIIKIDKPTDILIDGGFIFIKDKMIIKTNSKLELRDSIIK